MKLLCSYRSTLFVTTLFGFDPQSRARELTSLMPALDKDLKVHATIDSPITTVLFQFVDDQQHWVDFLDVVALPAFSATICDVVRHREICADKLARIRAGESVYKFDKETGKRTKLPQKYFKLRIKGYDEQIKSFRDSLLKVFVAIGYEKPCIAEALKKVKLSTKGY